MKAPAAASSTVWSSFVARAEASPNDEAIRWAGGCLSYGELLARALAVAEYLRHEHGVSPGDCIGVALPRNGWLPATLLGILATGAAYVPLDPLYPEDRLRFVMEDSGARLLLSPYEIFAPSDFPRTDVEHLERSPCASPSSFKGPAPDDLAYVIYTSGSTGRPKGVEVTHRSVASLVSWAEAAITPDERAGMLASTSISFDLSVFEIFVPLATGGRILLIDSILDLPEAPFLNEVRFLNTVPSAMAELLAAGGLSLESFSVGLAGEAFPAALAVQLHGARARRVLNLYGPTEDTVYSTWAEVGPSGSVPPIGVPLPGTRAYVVNGEGELCAPGEAGELYLAGSGLARGYRGLPEETARRFVSDRFTRDGGRMYRTGDRVRWREDDQLHYIGRLDDQVKVRGYRIELGEIEQVLSAIPGVLDCAVTVGAGRTGLDALLGYYVGDADQDVLRESLGRTLPRWMVPSLLMRVDGIPRSLNGKRLRNALPAPVWPGQVPDRPDGPDEPPADIGEAVRRLFSKILKRDAAADLNFISQGGDSLLALRLRAALMREFGLDMPLSALFANATPAMLADLIAREAPKAHAPVEAGATASVPDAKLTPLQWQMWLASRLAPDDDAYIITARIAIDGIVDSGLVERSLASVVERHASLRTGFSGENGQPWELPAASVSPHLPIIEMEEGLAIEEFSAGRLNVMRLAGFDLDDPPLLRAELVRASPGRSELLICAHHIVMDDRSLDVFAQDLARAYDALAEGRVPPGALPPVTGPVTGRQASASVRGKAKPGASLQSGRTAQSTSVIPITAITQLQDLARECEASPFMVLLAAMHVTMSEETGDGAVATLTAADGRGSEDADDHIGCFVAMAPVVTRPGPEQSFRQAVAAAKAATVEALEGRTTFAGGEGRWRNVAFTMQSWGTREAGYAGGTMTAIEIRPNRAHLPLTVWAKLEAGELSLLWSFREDSFSRDEVERVRRRYDDILTRAVAAPSSTIGELLAFRKAKPAGAPRAGPRSFPGSHTIRPLQSATLAAWQDSAERPLPAIVEAQAKGLSAATWARGEGNAIADRLRRFGGVLLRGFHVEQASDFRAFAQAISPNLIHYSERSSPRTEIAESVYSSTDHPAHQSIPLHTEQSYTNNWPMRILFWCQVAPQDRGRTPIADTARVLQRLSGETVRAFEERGILYVRNYLPGIGVSWQEAFQTPERDKVEEICRATDIRYEWVGPDHLRTMQRRPAIRRHPDTDERLWFNHGYFFNVGSLAQDIQDSVRANIDERDWPTHTFFGDGGGIPDEIVEEIGNAYKAEAVRFEWQKGDILLLDNMRVAHGREPFTGDRIVRTIMIDPINDYACAARPYADLLPE